MVAKLRGIELKPWFCFMALFWPCFTGKQSGNLGRAPFSGVHPEPGAARVLARKYLAVHLSAL